MASCFSAVNKQSPGSVFDEVPIFDVLGLMRAGCVAGWAAAWQDGFCKVHGVAAGTSDKAPVPCRTEEVWCRGKGVDGYMHTLHTGTPGAVNVGNERTRKCWYSPHILVVLTMADLCGQVGVRVKRTFL